MQLAFFRRHQRFFMVLMVLAVASMIVWSIGYKLWPRVLEWIGGRANPEVGSIGGRAVHDRQVVEFYRTIRVGSAASRWLFYRLAPEVQTADAETALMFHTIGRTMWPLLGDAILEERPDWSRVIVWMALYEEAKRWGFETADAEVEARLEALHGVGLKTADLERLIAQESPAGREAFDEGLRADMTLRAYVDWILETTGVAVEPELRRRFVRMDERAKVRLAVLKAEDFLSKVPQATDDRVAKQFEAYKAYLPGQGPKGFGYRIPDRVKIEYLVADPAAFEKDAGGRVSDEDVAAYYEAHKDPDFIVKEEPVKDAAKETGADAPAAETPPEKEAQSPSPSPEKPAKEKTFRPLEEVRDEIRRLLVSAEAKRLASERMQGDVAEVRAMKDPPDLRIWSDGTYVQYADEADFRTADQLAAVEGLGAATREGQTLPQTALALVELVGPEKGQLAANEISEVFTDPAGRMYACRVTAFEANHEPPSVQEVRDAVVKDLRLEAAGEAAEASAKKLLEAAGEKGLEAAAKKAGVAVEETDWFPRERFIPGGRAGRSFTFPPSLPVVGSSPPVVAECFRLEPGGQERSLVTLARERWAVVLELVGRKPPREPLYQAIRPLLAQEVGVELTSSARSDLLDEEAVRRRLRVIWAPPEAERAPAGEGGDEEY
jgi:hypothetical protein